MENVTDDVLKAPVAVVVDDEPLIRMGTADIVADAGFDVIEASCAQEAFDCLESEKCVALLLTDIQMPEIDGLTLARHVAARWPDVSIVVTSGALRPGIAELPQDARFISKPFSPEAVVDTIRQVCVVPND